MYSFLTDLYFKHRKIFPFLLSFFVIIISFLFAVKLSYMCTSYISLILSVIPIVPILNEIILRVEEDQERYREIRIKDLIIYVEFFFFLMLGAILSYYLAFIFYSSDLNLFFPQIKAINDIFRSVQSAGLVSNEKFFFIILSNNLKVLILTFILSFVFGAGALYIILWNASIVGVFLGLVSLSAEGSFVHKYIIFPLLKFIFILPHGIFEFTSFFLAALSGNYISIMLLKGYNFKDPRFHNILAVSIFTFMLAIMFLVLAAFIEAYI